MYKNLGGKGISHCSDREHLEPESFLWSLEEALTAYLRSNPNGQDLIRCLELCTESIYFLHKVT